MSDLKPAILLDRDDTILRDPGYLDCPGGVELLPGAAAAMKRLSDAGYLLVVVTNQSAVARGKVDIPTLDQIHEELRRQLREAAGVELAGIYYSPYHVDGVVPEFTRASDCRKPEPGMLLRAAEELGLDLSASVMIGDRQSDVLAGQRAGCRATVMLSQAPPQQWADRPADLVAPDLAQAADALLALLK